MDIDLFSKMIKELILDNDRVVLPGLGCFVAEMVPATFTDKGYTINPPYRRLYFRARPETDDTLVNFYAATNGLDKDVACKILGDFIAELRSIIFTKKLVVLPGLGRLRATKENNIFFIADEELDIYPAGFGMEPISLKTHKVADHEVSDALVGLKSILDEPVHAPEKTVEPPPVEEKVEETVEEVVTVEEEVATVEEEAPVAEEPISEPAQEPEVKPEVVEDIQPETVELQEKKCRKNGKLRALYVVLALAVVLLIAYVVLARIVPEWFDPILYTPEELEILNRVI